MPQVHPSLPAPANVAAAEQSSSRARRPRGKAPGGAFDDVLSGARRKEAAGPAPAREPERKADRPAGKRRAEASERTKRRETPGAKPGAVRADEAGATEDAERADRADDIAATEAAGEIPGDGAERASKARPNEGTRHDGADVVAADGLEAGSGDADDVIEPPAGEGAAAALPPVALPADAGDTGSVSSPHPDTNEAEPTAAAAGAADAPRDPAALLLADAGLVTPAAVTADGDISPELTGETPPEFASVAGATAHATRAAKPRHPNGAAPLGDAAAALPADGARAGEGRPTATPPVLEASSDYAARAEAIDAPAGQAAPAAAPVVSGAATAADLAAQAAAGVAPEPPPAPAQSAAPAPASAAALPPEARFAEVNHANIVREMRGQLMPDGGTMRLRLDPPELGPLAVTVRLRNGVMDASFEASSEEAAKLLSHSLGALKASLESQGVSVERLHVQHAPKAEAPGQPPQGGSDRDPQQDQPRDPQQEHAARQEHQRREMLRRMWRKLSGAQDPLDMVA